MIFDLRFPAHEILGGELSRMLELGQYPARGMALLQREGAPDIWANEAAIRQCLESPSCRALARIDTAGSFSDRKEQGPVVASIVDLVEGDEQRSCLALQ